jgi:predicted component of type VI protein secretion system
MTLWIIGKEKICRNEGKQADSIWLISWIKNYIIFNKHSMIKSREETSLDSCLILIKVLILNI